MKDLKLEYTVNEDLPYDLQMLSVITKAMNDFLPKLNHDETAAALAYLKSKIDGHLAIL